MSAGSSTVLNQGANISHQLYVQALSSVYFPGKWLYHPSFAELSDPEIIEKIKRDPVIAQAILYRKHLVAGRTWNVEPIKTIDDDDKALAVVIEDGLKSIDRFEASKFNLAEGVVRGSDYAYMEGQRIFMRLGDDKVERDWWIPKRLRHVGMERFRQFIEPDGNIRWELWAVKEMVWKPLTSEHTGWFVKHIYEDTERALGYGRGILEAMYIYYYAKEVVLEKFLQGIDRWALGMLHAKINLDKRTKPGQTAQELLAEWLSTLAKMRTTHALVSDKNDDIDALTKGMEGHQMCMNALEYLDTGLRILILGANLPTSATKGGSYNLAEVQSESTEAIIQFDRTLLAETLTRDLVGLFYRVNFQHIRDMGLDKAKKPKFTIVQEKRIDPEKAAAVISVALASDIPLKKQEVYERLGYSIPQKGDEVFVKAEGVPPPKPPTSLPFNDKKKSDGQDNQPKK